MVKIKEKRVCNKGGEVAKIWDAKKWWCSIDTLEGEFNMVGYCPQEKKK